MGETYTRQSSSTIVDGATIEASHFNAEFDQLLAAFQASTGHTHDGTANEGGPITKLLGNTLTFGAGTAGTDIAITFDGETSDGVLKWMEDEDYFEFSDDILVASTEKLQFRDTAIYINSSTDGQLDLVADTEIQIAATTVDINGNVDVSGTLTVGGALDFSDANITNIGSIALDTITNDGTDITLDSSGDIILDADGADITLKDAGTTFGSLTNSSGELVIKSGSTPTAAITLSGANTTIEGNLTVDGNFDVTGTLDFSDSAITNVGSIQLDSIAGDGDTNTSITFSGSDVITMATGGTSALTIDASQNVTIAGDLTVSGDDITMGTNTAGNLLVADGTNFNSVAVGSLSEISTVAGDDVLLAVDTSGGGLKKITRSTLTAGLVSGSEISNVVEDTSPQLGGSLDVNGEDIVSVSNGNITLTPNGTGVVRVDGSNGIDMQSGAISIKNSGAESYIRFYCESSNAHYTQLQAAPHSAYSGNVTVVLPASADTLVGRATTDTLTNKTLTTPVIAEIDSGSTITLDATTDIVLDADGGDIFLKDAGTTFGEFTNSSTDFVIKSTTSDKDIIFKGNDGGSAITALTLDMSAAGAATFNDKITAVGTSVFTNLDISGDVDIDGTLETDALSIASTTVTSTAAELNILDGVTSTASELNILDGVTSTTAELNILDGVTSTAAELNIMDGDTAASSVTLVDADRLVTNDAGTMKQVALTTLKTYLTSAGFSTEDPTALAIALG
jgi:cytoskeletal protein CcmA (bactofilin family)